MKNITAKLIFIFLIMGITLSQAQRIQAIHNASDPTLSTIDIYISVFGSQVDKIEDVPFRAGTSFIDVPIPNLPLDVGIAPGNSTSINDTLKNFTVVIPSGVTYIGLIQGVVNPSQFAPNPDGLNISLNAVVNQNGRETSSTPGNVDFFFIHGVTDAPTLDLNIHNGANLVNDISYGSFSGYISLSPTAYEVDITNASGSTILYSYVMDLSGFADSVLTVFASGFVNPSANQNGEPFGLFAVTPGGKVVQFSTVTDISNLTANNIDGFVLYQNYPNPFNPVTNLEFRISDFGFVSLKVYDVMGREVAVLVNEKKQPGEYTVQWDAHEFASGVYTYKLIAGDLVQSRKMLLLK